MKAINHFSAAALVALLAGTSITSVSAQPAWPDARPEAKAGTRWWWMGSAVDDASLRWNIENYAQTGIGTVEITPIYGVVGNEKNELSYLSGSWMKALQTTQQAADAHGVSVDMNGGTGWPFGGPTVKVAEAAGKLVTKTELLTADGTTALTMNVAAPEANATLNKVMAYSQGDDGAVVDVTAHVSGNSLQWTAPAGQWRLIAVFNGHTNQQVKRAAPGGEGLVLDHYDSTAVANYLKRFDQAFATAAAPGAGGQELRWPQSFFNDSYEVYGADWTPKMFDEFLKYRGYRLEDHLQELLGLKKDTDNQVLADYRQTLADMLLNNFTRQWTAWAHSHGVTTRNQGHGSPGNLLDFYAAVDIPEIESFGISDFKIKGLRTDPGFVSRNLSDFSPLKYASSAAHVTGKTFTSSETFTWLTEHFRTSLSQMKPDLDLMFVAGVNHVFFHGTTYTPQNAAWPGWKFYASIDMSPTNSIWHDAPAFMQYIERCQSFLQMGQPDNDLLVYAPFRNAMHKNTGTWANRLLLFDINTLQDKMPEVKQCVAAIEQAGLDCDYVSDALLLSTSYVDGMLQTVGGTRYKALVVPTDKFMPEEVKTHLAALAAQGARIVYGYDAASLAATGATPEAMRTDLGLRVIRRANATGHHYFIVNLSDRDVEGFVSLAVDHQGAVYFNPLNGQTTDALQRDGQVLVSLRSGESVILQTYATAVSSGTVQQQVVEVAPRPIGTQWTLSFTADSYPADRLQTSYALTELTGWQTLDDATACAMGTGVYETTFMVDGRMLNTATAGFRLNLGDVRESARVTLNDVSLGCLWSAPFVVDVPAGVVREGENTLRIEVTNLPANRIRQMDIDGQQWRIFKDVNILDVKDGSASVNNVTSFASWQLVPSGLCSPVMLVPLKLSDEVVTLQQTTFETTADGLSYPVYRLSTPSGSPVSHLEAVDDAGQPYSDYSMTTDEQGNSYICLHRAVSGYVQLNVTDEDGRTCQAYVNARGAYRQTMFIDFTTAEPTCGWNKTADALIEGFSATGLLTRYAAKKQKAVMTELFDGLTFTAALTNFYYFYPDYGMTMRRAAELTFAAPQDAVAMLSYLVGQANDGVYVAADSLCTFAVSSGEGIRLDMYPSTDYYIYRQLALYEPVGQDELSITPLVSTRRESSVYYTLQGLRTREPQRGLYIHNGRKVVKK